MTTSPMQVVLVGHRGTGKTTVGELAARRLGWRFVDLDAHIERRCGEAPATIISKSEARFRSLEQEQLGELLAEDAAGARLIALGAGCPVIPEQATCVWLWRDGWEETAKAARARLRPDLTFEQEVRWMRRTREPRWAEAAHLFLRSPRARSPEFAADILVDHLDWLSSLPDSELGRRTWMVPCSERQLERAVRDAAAFGLAGVEVRSDLLPEAQVASVDTLASLRGPEAQWLIAHRCAAAFDVDLAWLDAVLDAGVLETCTPRPLLLSTHPDRVDRGEVEALSSAAGCVARRHPAWADHLVLKYAPPVESFGEVERALELAQELDATARATTFLPQGERFGWLRPLLAHRQNATNYLPVGLRDGRLPRFERDKVGVDDTAKPPTPWDVQDWLPHLAGDAPSGFDGLIGHPVEHSMGDWWHRRHALANDEAMSYVKIPLEAGAPDEIDAALALIRGLGMRGLSVTSPLKGRVAPLVENPDELDALNTLRRTATGWTGTDTDRAGMAASLRAIEEAGFGPSTVAIIGRGGVSPAIRRAVEASKWRLVHHASAREGWGEAGSERVTLVVNAAGRRPSARDGAPACDVWLDLHYHEVGAAPPGVKLHLNGDRFFVAQAEEQRDFWKEQDSCAEIASESFSH